MFLNKWVAFVTIDYLKQRYQIALVIYWAGEHRNAWQVHASMGIRLFFPATKLSFQTIASD